MKIKLLRTNLSVIQKICFSGLIMALVVVLQKVVAINYLAFAPFVRVSFGGPALIIFASILLGPIYGLFIGIGSDLLGYLIFDPRMYPPYLQITAIYAVLGFVAYFIFSFVFSIKNRKVLTILEIAFMSIIWLAVSLFMILNNEITLFSSIYKLTVLSKVLVCTISHLLFVGIVIFSILLKPKGNNVLISPLHICFASFICDFFVLVLFGSVMKAWAFGFATFLVIIICQSLVMFFNVFIDTSLITAFQNFSKKYYAEKQNVRREEN